MISKKKIPIFSKKGTDIGEKLKNKPSFLTDVILTNIIIYMYDIYE